MSQWPAATVRYVFVGYVLIPLVINVAINVLLGGLLFLGQESIPVWSFPQSVAMEIVGTGFLLPLITAMISSRVLIRHLRSGMVQPILKTEASSGIISRLLVVLRGGLSVFDDPSIPRSPRRFSGPFRLIAIKAVYAGLCGVVVTPLIASGLLHQSGQSLE